MLFRSMIKEGSLQLCRMKVLFTGGEKPQPLTAKTERSKDFPDPEFRATDSKSGDEMKYAFLVFTPEEAGLVYPKSFDEPVELMVPRTQWYDTGMVFSSSTTSKRTLLSEQIVVDSELMAVG